MKKFSAESRQEPALPDIAHDADAPLWLLQKDDTRFLYLSLFLSISVHFILFAIMAATRIFHPITGASQEFDLVWFSPAAISAPAKSSTPKASIRRPEKIIKTPPTTEIDTKTVTTTRVKTESQPTPLDKTPPQPSQNAPAPVQVPSPDVASAEEPAEMIISRFDGKVIDVVAKKSDLPTFTVISSVKIKSKSARAAVQSIRETTTMRTEKLLKAPPKTKASATPPVVLTPKKPPPEKNEETSAVAAAPAKKAGSEQRLANEKPVQRKISSASVATVEKPVMMPPVNRSINSFAAALAALSPAKKNPVAGEQVSLNQVSGITGDKKASSPQVPSKTKLATLPVTVEKPVPQEAKPSPQPPSTPPMIFHPPVTGDLKLVITGDVEAKVEVSFKPFPKTRRSKPFTRRESENHRNIIPIYVRTKENVHEAVVEGTEEGIYTIFLRPANGKGGSARLVLKVHESQQGASTKDLGTRKIDGVMEIAKILMPDGILWSEGSNFTGDMEDADSITKFNSETGLMWREYK